MLHTTLLPMAMLFAAGIASAQSGYSLQSPNGRIKVAIRTGDSMKYDVLFDGKVLLQDSTFSIDIDHTMLGLNPRVTSAKTRSYDQTIAPDVRQKFAKIRDHYNELRLVMEGGLAVTFRAYDQGAAYRLETSLPQREVKVYNEVVALRLPGDRT